MVKKLAESNNIIYNGNILAFDFGEKKIGVAVGNSITKTARPLETIRKIKKIERNQIIDRLLKEWGPSLLVVGLPLNEDGTESRLTGLAKTFAEKIQNRFKIDTVMVDERYTSVEAKLLIRESTKNITKGSKLIDQVAAKIILESYFEKYQ
jgi:putative Holliday junction resolvase